MIDSNLYLCDIVYIYWSFEFAVALREFWVWLTFPGAANETRAQHCSLRLINTV